MLLLVLGEFKTRRGVLGNEHVILVVDCHKVAGSTPRGPPPRHLRSRKFSRSHCAYLRGADCIALIADDNHAAEIFRAVPRRYVSDKITKRG